MNPPATGQRTRIKICGITSRQEMALVAECGADSVGLVFHPSSKRHIEIEKAVDLMGTVPPFMTVTALFLDESDQLISRVIDRVRPDCLQFHGTESEADCHKWGVPYIKAIPMGSTGDANRYAERFPSAQGFLMDSNAAGLQGGSGDTFDWSKIPADFRYPLILAGGLNPQNVADAVISTRPWAVDVSSGVESSEPDLGGLKNGGLIRQFCDQVFRADCQALS